jgi:hypothetical protein
MRTSIARLIVVFGLLIGALAFGTAVSADPGNGSSYTITNQCSAFLHTSVCLSEKGEVNVTVSEDGTVHFEQNARGSDTGTHFGVPFSDTYSYHQQSNGDQEGHYLFKDTATYGGETFCVTERFHYANGQTQFDGIDVTPGAC